jgi:1,4-alpha-glucan branching enzyme
MRSAIESVRLLMLSALEDPEFARRVRYGDAGSLLAYWKQEVRQLLIDNARFFFDEYHVDGFRFDEVTVIDDHGGWLFLQHLTDTLRHRKPEAPLIAEYRAGVPRVAAAPGWPGSRCSWQSPPSPRT